MELSCFHCTCFYNYILFVASDLLIPFIVVISSFSCEVNLFIYKRSPFKEKH